MKRVLGAGCWVLGAGAGCWVLGAGAVCWVLSSSVAVAQVPPVSAEPFQLARGSKKRCRTGCA